MIYIIIYKKYIQNIRKVPKLHIHTKQNNLDLRVKCKFGSWITALT